MPVKKTPPIYARGRFVLHPPWSAYIDTTKLYECIAIRSFKDIYEDGLDVEKEFYTPNGLIDGQPYGGTPFSFANEKDARANIITLIRDDKQQYIYVPDTYIAAYPDMTDVKYSNIIVTLDFGAMPDYLDLSAIRTSIANLAGSNIGKIPATQEFRTASANAPTAMQHDALEAARLGAITNRETDYMKITKLNAQNQALQDTVDKLTDILQANGWLPT